MKYVSPMNRAWRASACKSPVVLSFWQATGGRTPEHAVIQRCNEITKNLKRKEPPFQSDRYEYADLLGVRVIERNIPDRKLQGILSKNGSGYLIVVNQQDPPERRSFTVCHELGHIQMLTKAEAVLGREKVLNHHMHGSSEEERLSDMFAANLLMPRKVFSKAAKDLAPSMASLTDLAGRFRTSVGAAARRIVDLNTWACSLLWCSPEKVIGGRFVVKIHNVMTSPSVKNPPVLRERHVRWGVDTVYDAYHNKRLSRSTVTFRHPGRHIAERWAIECLYREGQNGGSVLALMFQQ